VGAKLQRFFILFLFLFSGCTAASAEPTPTAFTPAVTPQVAQQIILQESTPAQSAASDQDLCGQSGSIKRYQIDSDLLNGPLFFSVYFPPCYDTQRETGYPVLYALHGQNFNDTMWVDLGLAEKADALIQEEITVPFLVVMPYEAYYYRSAEENNFPAALLEEILPWVERSFNVCTEKTCRAIGGISRGASWAVRIGLAEWERIGAVGAHSLPTFQGDISNLPLWLEEIPDGEEPRIYLDTGRFDPEVKNAYRFEQVLSEKGIPHDWHLNPGHHNEAYWRENMESYLRWYSQGWQ
jgi:enterochelin esterase-like enzyme